LTVGLLLYPLLHPVDLRLMIDEEYEYEYVERMWFDINIIGLLSSVVATTYHNVQWSH